MNNWQAVGYIALAWGFVFLVNALYNSTLVGESLRFKAMVPMLDYAVLAWVVAVVYMLRG